MGQLKHGLNRYEIYLFRTRIYTRICFVFFIKERPCSYKWVLNFQAKQKGTSPPTPRLSSRIYLSCSDEYRMHLCLQKESCMTLDINRFNEK